MTDNALQPKSDGRRPVDAQRDLRGEELLRQVALLENDLEQARRDLNTARAEARRARIEAASAAHQAERVRDTISFRLGNALIQCRSWRNVLALPGELASLARDSRKRRTSPADLRDAQEWRTVFENAPEDPQAAIAYALQSALPRQDAARLLVDLAKGRRAYDPSGAVELGRAALEIDRRPVRVKWLATLMHDAGMISEPAELAAEALRSGAFVTATAKGKLDLALGLARARASLAAPPARGAPAYAPKERTVLYVAASSLPHHVSGYTTRTHNLVRAMRGQGWDVQVVTRPGYPWDRRDSKDVDGGRLVYAVGDMVYERLSGPPLSETPLDVYIERAAVAIEAKLRATRAGVVHAASNYVNALPALVAARRAGVPFAYSVRGLWELTAASKRPGWEHTERFALERELESLVAKDADVVLTLTAGLRQELIDRGVAPERIRLAPNSVDVEQFTPTPKDEALAMRLGLSGRCVVGFLGSLIDYEGLDHLLEAAAVAVAAGVDMGVLIVGDGPVAAQVQEQARQLGLSDRVVMTGRVPPESVPGYYSLVDIAAFPRKPFQVCEIVSPLKPLEAMAMGKAVVASDVGALAEMVRHDETGLLFPKGRADALAEALIRLATTPALARRLGDGGRAWVERERTWAWCASQVTGAYQELVERRGAQQEQHPNSPRPECSAV